MNEKTAGQEKIKMVGEKMFQWILVTILSIIVLLIIVRIVLYNSKINQGQMRAVDIVLTSTAKLDDTSAKTGTWSYNISQYNLLSVLVQSASNTKLMSDIDTMKKIAGDIPINTIAEVVIDNIHVEGAEPTNIYISQKNFEEEQICLANENTLKLNSTWGEDKQLLYEIEIINTLFREHELSKDITEVEHNGKIFNLLNVPISQLTFTISFDIEFKEHIGKNNQLKVKLTIPSPEILSAGYKVEKLDLSDFNFRIK